jgi:hypothetical protein
MVRRQRHLNVMTDFLHPQSVSTSQPPEDVLTTPPDVQENESHQVQESESASVDSAQNQRSQTNSIQANQERVRRNFATSKERRKSVQEELNDGQGEPRTILRKESPLFVNYYQSVFLILIALFIVSGYVVLNPLITDFKKTNESIRSGLQESDDAQAFLDSVNRSIRAAESISSETLSRVNEALPKEVEIPKLLKTFAQIADQDHVTMGGIQFSPQESGSSGGFSYQGYSLGTVQVSVSIQAPGYLAMRKYLEDLQTNVRLIDVKTISVNGDSATGAFSYSLELTSYYIQKSVASPVAAPIGGAGGIMAPPAAPKPNEI